MEKLMRIMTNGRVMSEDTRLVEGLTEVTEFVAVAMACMVVVSAIAIF